MELVPSNGEVVATVTTEPVTTRSLTLTIKVADTADIDAIIKTLSDWGEVTGVNYYQQTYTQNTNDPGYIF